jgi:hypothetical protein
MRKWKNAFAKEMVVDAEVTLVHGKQRNSKMFKQTV